MAKKRHELTEAEWIIIKAIWGLEPCTAPDVQKLLSDSTGWHYSTVKTVMDRMVEKGFLKAQRIRNLNVYRSAITESKARKGEVARTLRRAFDDALTPMMQFILDSQDLSEAQLKDMESMIKAKRRGKT